MKETHTIKSARFILNKKLQPQNLWREFSSSTENQQPHPRPLIRIYPRRVKRHNFVASTNWFCSLHDCFRLFSLNYVPALSLSHGGTSVLGAGATLSRSTHTPSSARSTAPATLTVVHRAADATDGIRAVGRGGSGGRKMGTSRNGSGGGSS